MRFAFTHDDPRRDGELIGGGRLYVFTTRADTIMGVTFCAVAPEHPLATLAARIEPGTGRVHRRVQARRRRWRRTSRRGEEGHADGTRRARIR